MRQYNKEELLLKAWRDKLQNTVTKRTKLKQELVDLLNADTSSKQRIEAFNKRRKELLSKQHSQGFTWASSFSWLSTILSWVLPHFLAKFLPFASGSNLRGDLNTVPTLDNHSILSPENFIEHPTAHQVQQGDFEEIMLENPQAALVKLQFNINQLEKNQDANGLENVLEQLNAIKEALTPTLYQQMLEKLFLKYPKDTLLYQYKAYTAASMSDAQNPHEFIAHNLMARTIIRHFISSICTSQVPHAIDKLITLLNRNSSEEKDWFLNEILNKWDGKKSQNLLDDAFEIAHPGQAHLYDYTIRSVSKSHPLIKLVAKYAAEELFLIYSFGKEATTFHNRCAGSTCLINIAPILGYHSKNKISLDWLKYPFNRTEFLNSFFSNQEADKLENMASDLIMNCTESSSLYNAAYRIAKINHQKGSVLSNEDWHWIESRLKGIHSDYIKGLPENFITELEYILRKIHFYHEDNLKSLICSQKTKPEQLIGELNDYLDKAKEARKNCQAEQENMASKQAVAIFQSLLTCPRLKSEEINALQAAFKILQQYYLTNDVKDMWQKKLESRTNTQPIYSDWNLFSLPLQDNNPSSGNCNTANSSPKTMSGG